MDATFTANETALIWLALSMSEPKAVDYLSAAQIKDMRAEAMTILAAELRKVGVFPPLRPACASRLEG